MQRPFLIIFFVIAVSHAAVAQTQEMILPVVVNGYVREPLHYQTTIRIVNLSNSSVEVTLEAYQNDGVPVRILELFPIPRQGTKTVFRIDSLGSVEASTAGSVPPLNGWARLTYDLSATIEAGAEVALIKAPVGPQPICNRPSTDFVTSVQVPSATAAWKFAGFAVIRSNRQGAYAILNPSATSTATVFLSLLDFSGKLVAASTIEIPPQGRTSRFLSEYLPGAPADFMGSLRITSNIPVVAAALNVLVPEGKFTSVALSSLARRACIQVITPARNPLTGECRNFPTPCDVPEGWVITQSCN